MGPGRHAGVGVQVQSPSAVNRTPIDVKDHGHVAGGRTGASRYVDGRADLPTAGGIDVYERARRGRRRWGSRHIDRPCGSPGIA